ncbi:D-3-phosphoglycerate dehydrogenase [Clostridia bacterium]|nr:D-3-phosphoglycerate dehydrogenase [Clostridia bacterium]
MIEIQTLNKISPLGTNLFDREKYNISDAPNAPDAVLVRSANMLDSELKPNLLAIARAGAGVNNIPIQKCSEQGVVVFNTPGANANAVKEIVVAGLLLSSRKISDGINWAKSLKGKGDEVGKLVEKGKGNFGGTEIKGKTLGLIGLGAIGALVANIAVSLGMRVVGTDPFLSVSAALKLKPEVKVLKTPDEVYKEADYISLHLPFNAETKGIINKDVIAKMRDGVKLLNFARGELVNDADLIEALKSGKVSVYVTDFPNDNTLGVDNIVAIPHLGASSEESEDNCAVMASQQLIDYLESGNITNSVNLPNVELITEYTKICIIHKNIPSIISAITNVFGTEKINVENMVDKSKKDYAYAIFDVNGEITEKVISEISDIEGIIKIRVIK